MASSSTLSRPSAHVARSPESYESLARRNAAAEILQSYERLSWHSFQRCESLVQTRLHFQNVLAGLTDQDEAALVDWKEDKTPRPKPGDEGHHGSSRKGKERLSGGVAGPAPKANKTREQSDSSTGGSAKKKRKSLQ
ncbi:hypothetical protein BDY17DRAFT_327807 [Neohortaea acidophila]|uniref:Uncharacterized protein n=1 Tax=Neohortaea acidophila TaxID=245834 RepID=A0A6A6PGA4_9PEZI|nr:uncharacterized protein BDY17DRAFT_327807 [Neohortaea acidophila]KAF2478999.1 hypothetical protein BDY17DRAFT_327807 [Neohortaea acidophila]